MTAARALKAPEALKITDEYPRRGSYVPAELGARCDICPIAKRKVPAEPVPPYIPKGKPKLVVMGEAPGYYESLKAEPFVGKSGMLLNAVLGESRFHRNEAVITNAAVCRLEDERAEKEAAIACCSPRLARELSGIDAKVPILTLGSSASKPLLPKPGIQRIRGFLWEVPEVDEHSLKEAAKSVVKRREKLKKAKSKGDTKELAKTQDAYVKAIHRELHLRCRSQFPGRVVFPSTQRAFIVRGAAAQRPLLSIDIERAIRWARSIHDTGAGFPLEDSGSYEVVKTPKELRKALRGMRKEVEIDIESNAADALYSKITCIGLSDDFDGKGRTIVIEPETLRRGWVNSFAPILTAFFKTRLAVTHFGMNFDVIRLRRARIHLPKVADTLVAYHAYAGHLRKGLDHVTSVYCDARHWKILSKAKESTGEKGGFYAKPSAELAQYNAADVRLGIRDWRRMQTDLDTERSTYEFDMEVAGKICQQMQVNGLRIDIAKRDFLSAKLGHRASALLGEMRSLLRRPGFMPGSLDDLRRALFTQCRVPTYLAEKTPTGLLSTGKLLLEALRDEPTRAGKLADLVLRRRSALDCRAEYLDNLPIGSDGRVHPVWNICGTATGRPATSNPNVLNQPRYSKDPEEYEEHVRAIYIAAPGCVFVYYDLKQSEPRFAAYVSGDPNFIAAVEKDVHTVNATVLFPKLAEMILADPKGKGADFRQIAKSCGLAVTYLSSPETVYAACMKDDKIRVKPSLGECSALVETLKSKYKGYFSYVQGNVSFAKKHGLIRSPFEGRLRRVGFYAEESILANSPIQMSVADVMGRRLLATEKIKPKSAKLVFYGYDSACYETPTRDVARMQDVCREIWEAPVRVPGNGLEFIQGIDMKEPSERLSDF